MKSFILHLLIYTRYMVNVLFYSLMKILQVNSPIVHMGAPPTVQMGAPPIQDKNN